MSTKCEELLQKILESSLRLEEKAKERDRKIDALLPILKTLCEKAASDFYYQNRAVNA